MLAIAERARTSGLARFERRGPRHTAYEPCEQPAATAAVPQAARSGFVCADVLDLPIRGGAVDHALALNVVDCVASPPQLLGELARVLAPGRDAVVATPYDWSPAATPCPRRGSADARSAPIAVEPASRRCAPRSTPPRSP